MSGLRRGYQRPERISSGVPDDEEIEDVKGLNADMLSIYANVQQNLPSLDGFDSDSDNDEDDLDGGIKIFTRADGKSSLDKNFLLNPMIHREDKEDKAATAVPSVARVEVATKEGVETGVKSASMVSPGNDTSLDKESGNKKSPEEEEECHVNDEDITPEEFSKLFQISNASQPYASYLPMNAPTLEFQFEDKALDELLESLDSGDFVDEWDELVQECVVVEDVSIIKVQQTLDTFIKERKQMQLENSSKKESKANGKQMGRIKEMRNILMKEATIGPFEYKKSDSESKTVYLDLRPSTQKEDQLSSVKVSDAASRIMSSRITVDNKLSCSESSEEEDDDPIAWRQQRKKLISEQRPRKARSQTNTQNRPHVAKEAWTGIHLKDAEIPTEAKEQVDIPAPSKNVLSSEQHVTDDEDECSNAEKSLVAEKKMKVLSEKEIRRRAKAFDKIVCGLIEHAYSRPIIFDETSSFENGARMIPFSDIEFCKDKKQIALLSMNISVHPVVVVTAAMEWLLSSFYTCEKEFPFRVLSLYHDLKDNNRYLRVLVQQNSYRGLINNGTDWDIKLQLFLEKTSLGVIGEDFSTFRKSYKSSSKLSSILSSSAIDRHEILHFLNQYNERPSLICSQLNASQYFTRSNKSYRSDNENVAVLIAKDHSFAKLYAVRSLLRKIYTNGLDIVGFKLVHFEGHTSEQGAIGDTTSSQWAYYLHELTLHEAYTEHTKALVIAVKGEGAVEKLASFLGPADPHLAKDTDPQSLRAQFGETKIKNCFSGTRNKYHAKRDVTFWFGAKFIIPRELLQGITAESDIAAAAKDCFETVRKQDSISTIVYSPEESCMLVVSPLVPNHLIGKIIEYCETRGFTLKGIKRTKLDKSKADQLRLKDSFIYLQPAPSTPIPPTDCFKTPKAKGQSPSLLLLLSMENASFHINTLIDSLHKMLHAEPNSKQTYCGIPRTDLGLYSSFKQPISSSSHSSDNISPNSSPYFSKLEACSQTEKIIGDFYAVPDRYGVEARVNSTRADFQSFPEMEQTLLLGLRYNEDIKLGTVLSSLLKYSHTNYSLYNEEQGGTELLGIKLLPEILPYQAKELTSFEVGDEEWEQSIDDLCKGKIVLCALRKRNGFSSINQTLSELSIHSSNIIMSQSPEMAFRQISMFFREKELFQDPFFLKERSLYYPPSLKTKGLLNSLFQTPELLHTVAIIKPGILPLWTKIMKTLNHEGFEVVGLKFLSLRGKQARALLTGVTSLAVVNNQSSLSEADANFEKSEKYLQSGPVLVLCLRRYNAVRHLLRILGPECPSQAREIDSYLLRSLGKDRVHNCIHGSKSYNNAIREKDIFFAEGLCSNKRDKANTFRSAVDNSIGLSAARNRRLQRSETASSREDEVMISLKQIVTVLFLPGVVRREDGYFYGTGMYANGQEGEYIYLLDQIMKHGFKVVNMKMVHLTKSQAGEYCSERVHDLSSGPVVVIALERENCLIRLQQLLGSRDDSKSLSSVYGEHIIYPSNEKQAEMDTLFFFNYLCDSSFEIVTK